MTADPRHPASGDTTVTILAWMFFLVPAIGMPNELVLQDTLKSAVVALGVLMAAVHFFWRERNRTAPLRWHGMLWVPVALMLYALGSMVWSHAYLAAVEAIRWFTLGLLVWLGLNTLQRDNLPRLLWGVHCGITVASLWAVLQFLSGWSLYPQGPVPASTFFNRNFFAEYAVCVWPLSLWLLAQLRAARAVPWMALSMALNTVALLMTGTRSALVAFLVVVPVSIVGMYLFRRAQALPPWGRLHTGAAAFLLVAGIVVLGNVSSTNPEVLAEHTGTTALQRSVLRVASVGDSAVYTEGSFSVRALMWKATARMLIAHPWTGVGAGAWEARIPEFQRAGSLRETDYYVHNDLLQLLAEYGAMVGGLCLAFLLAYGLVSLQTTWRLRQDFAHAGSVRLAALTSLLALLLVANAGFPLHLAGTGALLALGLACMLSSDAHLGIRAPSFTRGLPWSRTTGHAAWAGSVLCLVLAATITYQAVQVERKLVQCLIALSRPGAIDEADVEALMRGVREAVRVHPHYRKLTPSIADQLAARGRWSEAAWIWESTIASRPQVPAFWFNLATAYLQLGRYADSQKALETLTALQPGAIGAQALQATLFSRTGQVDRATLLVTQQLDQGDYDYDLLQAGYAIGLASSNWDLAIRSLELRKTAVPSQAADVYLKMGRIYATPEARVHSEAQALAAFRAGLRAVPAAQATQYRAQVPAAFRNRLLADE